MPRRVVFSARMGEADEGCDAPLAQLVERQSHNLKVASSILAGSNSLRFISFVVPIALFLARRLRSRLSMKNYLS